MFPGPLGFLFRLVFRSPVCLPLLLSAGILLVAEPCQARSAGFENTGNMAQVRAAHTATLLPDGRVLAAGGETAGNFVSAIGSAELYDPASRSWSVTGSLINVRAYHTATLLPDGDVLVAGGQGTGILSSAELYDHVATWSGGMPSHRACTSAFAPKVRGIMRST